MLAQNRKY